MEAICANVEKYPESLLPSLSPISYLPSELLGAILLHAHKDNPFPPIELVASRISRFWNTTSAATAGLWTVVDLRARPSAYVTVERTALYLARSHVLPLTVHIRCNGEEDWPRLVQPCSIIFQNITRIRALAISALSDGVLEKLLRMLPPTAPKLETLRVAFRKPYSWTMSSVVPIFSGGAPRLSSLTIHNIDFSHFTLPLAHVETFQWHGATPPLPSSSGMYELLAQMPNVIHLCTESCTAEIQRATHALTLTALKPSPHQDFGDLVRLALGAPVQPTSLTLRSLRAHDMPPLYHAIAQNTTAASNLAAVRALALVDCDAGVHHALLAAVLSRPLSGVTTLTLAGSATRPVLRALTPWDESAPGTLALPALRRLVLARSASVPADALCMTVHRRARSDAPLAVLALSRSYVDAMSSSVLAQLRSYVEIETVDGCSGSDLCDYR